jgi:hypothetical protein
MKRAWVVLLLTLVSFAILGSQPPSLGPGGIRVHGSTNDFEQFYLDVTLVQGSPEMWTIQAVKIYAEPSHTLLYALVDEAAPVSVLTRIQGEKPLAMTTSTIGQGSSRVMIGAPSGQDSRIRVDYITEAGGTTGTLTVAESNVSSMLDFDFTSEPAAGKYKLCGYCSGLPCTCIYCPTPLFTTCCPACTSYCGTVTCP